MLLEEVKQNVVKEKDKQVVDDLMDELANFQSKIKSDQSIKHDDDDDSDHKKKKKHHRKKSRYENLTESFLSCIRHCSLNHSHKDRKRRRHTSSGSENNSRSHSSDSDRSSSPRHRRSSKKSKRHDRNESPPQRKEKPSVPDKPTVGSIYDGTVMSIMQWGCFVRLDHFRTRTEGLVHISNVSRLLEFCQIEMICLYRFIKIELIMYQM